MESIGQPSRDWDPRITPWCPKHWEEAKAGGTMATVRLMEEFVAKLAANGMISKRMPPGRITALRVEMAPICCYVGGEARARVANVS